MDRVITTIESPSPQSLKSFYTKNRLRNKLDDHRKEHLRRLAFFCHSIHSVSSEFSLHNANFWFNAYHTHPTLYTPNCLAMKMETNPEESVASSGKKSCSSCKASRKHPLSNNLGHESGPSPVNIILRVKITCQACKAGFEQLALRKTRAYWTKKNLQNWAESTSSSAHKPIGLAKKYLVRFRRGTTLKLRNGAKISTLRVPNRWTSAN